MKKGNVLVIGNSGVGKSTLINAVLGEDRIETSFGTHGTTQELGVYENDNIPFRVIDTIGFEPTFFKERKAINAVKKWSKNCIKKDENNEINLIWFCVDGTSTKLFLKTIQNLSRATSIWKSIPIIVVITKSYSMKDRKNNIEMVQNAFAKQKIRKNLKGIIPVVASTFELNETAFAAPEGIDELINRTNELLPEGIKAAKVDLANYVLQRKRSLAHGIVGVATASGITIGAIPLGFADAALLGPLEVSEVNAIAKVYSIKNDEESKRLINSIVEVGTVSIAAKQVIAALKNIPGLHVATSVLNATIAGIIVAALGEGSIYVFEQIYLGNKTVKDIDWVTKFLEAKLTNDFIEKVKKVIIENKDNLDLKHIPELLKKIFDNTNKN